MKKKITNSSLILILAASGVAFFAGCASMETDDNTKSLLSEAGFRLRTPQTAKQRELYAALPNNKVEHAIQWHFAQAAEEEMNPSLAVSWNNQWGPRHNG